MSLLLEYVDRLLPVIETDLRTVLETPAGYPPLLYQMLHYHMGWVNEEGRVLETDRGKRIRPLLSLLVCEAASGDFQAARPAAAAVELIHNFSLLHDDIQDRSPLRRNRRTVWRIWGEAQAINSGDTLYTLAYQAIFRLSQGQESRSVCGEMTAILNEVCLELTRGQHLDIAFESRDRVSTDEYLNMVTGKTAALIGGAALLGAVASRINGPAQTHYQAFGHNLGMAFQVLDDILDIWGDPALTGKEAAIDIRQRKKSLPVLYGLARSPALQNLYAAGNPFSEDDIRQVIELLDQVEARDYAAGLAHRYSDKTLLHLEAAMPRGQAGVALRELTHQLLNRDH